MASFGEEIGGVERVDVRGRKDFLNFFEKMC